IPVLSVHLSFTYHSPFLLVIFFLLDLDHHHLHSFPTRRSSDLISRMTIVSSIGEGAAHRVEANIYKLVNVLSVEDVTHASTISRSLALIKVDAPEESRHRLMEIVRVFRARVVDLAPRSLIIEITGAEDKLRALWDVLRPF